MLCDLADILDVRVADLLEVGERRPSVQLSELDVKPPARGRKPKPQRRPRRS
jgi:hypothetical protein